MRTRCPRCSTDFAHATGSRAVCPTCGYGGKRYPRRAVAAVLAALVVLGASTVVWTQIDLDADGLATTEEWRHGTSAWRADTDGDGLADGWETARGADPRHSDSDRDGVADGQEITWGSDPLSADTDGDGMDDLTESLLPRTDCNGDGILVLAQVDDDSDGRPDHEERPEHRCNPDMDEDGVLDGQEGHEECVMLPDCDADGLEDGQEHGSAYDPLNPDSFDTGLYDSVLWAFEARGQSASGDTDDDGIPDAWEGASGLIGWGPYAPATDKPDLLIEYVRVQGPDSWRYRGLDMGPSYQAIEAYIEQDTEFNVQWVETRVDLPTEQRPHLIPSRHSDYYERVLDEAAHSLNPYVTTIVLNPQHDQADMLHLGVAPIRGMLAAVDYGAHTWVDFDFDGQRVRFSPFWESIIAGNRQDYIRAAGFQSGGVENGEHFLRAPSYTFRWQPYWFSTAPRAEFDDGSVLPSTYVRAGVDAEELAHTILHELGHTLGLCHVELPHCFANLSASDQFDAQSSTMYSGAAKGTLHFLPSEWEQVRTYLTCPPQRPIQLLAEDAAQSEILDAKYGYALEDVLNIGARECGSFVALDHTFSFAADLPSYRPAEADRSAPTVTGSVATSIAYAAASVLLALGAAAAAWALTARRSLLS